MATYVDEKILIFNRQWSMYVFEFFFFLLSIVGLITSMCEGYEGLDIFFLSRTITIRNKKSKREINREDLIAIKIKKRRTSTCARNEFLIGDFIEFEFREKTE